MTNEPFNICQISLDLFTRFVDFNEKEFEFCVRNRTVTNYLVWRFIFKNMPLITTRFQRMWNHFKLSIPNLGSCHSDQFKVSLWMKFRLNPAKLWKCSKFAFELNSAPKLCWLSASKFQFEMDRWALCQSLTCHLGEERIYLTRWKHCVSLVNDGFGLVAAHMYVTQLAANWSNSWVSYVSCPHFVCASPCWECGNWLRVHLWWNLLDPRPDRWTEGGLWQEHHIPGLDRGWHEDQITREGNCILVSRVIWTWHALDKLKNPLGPWPSDEHLWSGRESTTFRAISWRVICIN